MRLCRENVRNRTLFQFLPTQAKIAVDTSNSECGFGNDTIGYYVPFVDGRWVVRSGWQPSRLPKGQVGIESGENFGS
jgi:hypothetical protein